jgi:hypothetical protein
MGVPHARAVGKRLARRATAALSVLTIGVFIGCGAHSVSQGTGVRSDPATVALGYSRALFLGDYAEASRYVVPSDRNAFLALTTGLGKSSITSRHLAVGSTTVTGSTAVSILTGTIYSRTDGTVRDEY